MGVFIGIDIGGTNLRGALFDEKSRILKRVQLPTGADEGYRSVLGSILKILDDLSSCRKKINAVGIGCAGLIDHAEGFIHFSPNFKGWKNISLRKDIESIIHLPIFLINDVNSALWGEICTGAAGDSRNVLCVTLGTGLGGGLLLNGELYIGQHNLAGEIGHVILKPGGKICGCGKKGCLESYVSSSHIVRMARKRLAQSPSSPLRNIHPLTVKDIADAAKKGDSLSQETFDEMAGYLGIGLANAAVLLDLDRILVGGTISRAGRVLFSPLRKTFRKNIWKFTPKSVRITPTTLGSDSGLVGAALWAKHQFQKKN